MKRELKHIARVIREQALESIQLFKGKIKNPLIPLALFNMTTDDTQEIKTCDFLMNNVREQMRYTTLPDWITTVDQFNVDVMDWVVTHADTIAGNVHMRTSSFELTPAQMVAIHYVAYGSLSKVTYGYEMEKKKVIEGNVAYLGNGRRCTVTDCHAVMSLDPHIMPSKVRIVTFPMGTGKTIITVAAMELVLFSDLGKEIAQKIFMQTSRDFETGYRRESTTEFADMATARIAPIVLFFVPRVVLNHWKNTIYDLQEECERLFGRRVRVWSGYSDLKSYSVETAFKDQIETFWILPLESKAQDVLYHHPDIAVSGVVYDEMNVKVSKNGNRKRSPIAGPVLVAQATIETLKKHFKDKSRYNVLLNFIGEGALRTAEELTDLIRDRETTAVQRSLVSMGKFSLSMPPETLMTMLAYGSVHKMPSGIRCYAMTGKATFVRSFFYGTLTTDLFRIIEVMMRNVFVRGSYVSTVDGHDFMKFAQSTDQHIIITLNDMDAEFQASFNRGVFQFAESARRDFTDLRAWLSSFIKPCTACGTTMVFSKCDGTANCYNPACAEFKTATTFARMPVEAVGSAHEKIELLRSKASDFTSTELVILSLQVLVEECASASALLFCDDMKDDFFCFLRARFENTDIVDFEAAATNSRKVRSVLDQYNDPRRKHPMVLVCSLRGDSNTIAGTDLKNTTGVVIYGPLWPDQTDQVIGRVLRMNDKSSGATIPFVNVK